MLEHIACMIIVSLSESFSHAQHYLTTFVTIRYTAYIEYS